MTLLKRLVGSAVFPLIGYRPSLVSAETWDREYKDGRWNYLGGMKSMGGLLSIFGYTQFLAPQSVLDVGCGEGLLAEKLMMLPIAHYLGIDISPEAIARAQKMDCPNATFAVADALTFHSDRRFDIVVFNQILYYMPDPAAVIAHYRTMLTPNGYFIVSMYDAPRTRVAWPLVAQDLHFVDSMTITQGGGAVVTKVFQIGSA